MMLTLLVILGPRGSLVSAWTRAKPTAKTKKRDTKRLRKYMLAGITDLEGYSERRRAKQLGGEEGQLAIGVRRVDRRSTPKAVIFNMQITNKVGCKYLLQILQYPCV